MLKMADNIKRTQGVVFRALFRHQNTYIVGKIVKPFLANYHAVKITDNLYFKQETMGSKICIVPCVEKCIKEYSYFIGQLDSIVIVLQTLRFDNKLTSATKKQAGKVEIREAVELLPFSSSAIMYGTENLTEDEELILLHDMNRSNRSVLSSTSMQRIMNI